MACVYNHLHKFVGYLVKNMYPKRDVVGSAKSGMVANKNYMCVYEIQYYYYNYVIIK